jgi:hypothetical protein
MQPYEPRELSGVGEGMWVVDMTQSLTNSS